MACGFSMILAGTGILYLQAQNSQNFSPPFPSGPIVPSGIIVPHDAGPGNTEAIPASFPDKFAWMLFAKINQKASKQGPITGTTNISNDAIWETWPDDAWTFPAAPVPANPPQWPGDGQNGPRKLLRGRAVTPNPARAGADVSKLDPAGFYATNGPSVGEEVRRNRPTFDYIVTNRLWYQQGIAAFFARSAAVATNEVQLAARAVNFPRGSIEVKGNWIVISETNKARYHWNYNTSGQLLGLVAFHVISKDLPNWFWCTFEHVDNPGRGDYIGIHDSFGANPPHTPSRTDQLFQKYPTEQLTANALNLLATNGFKGDWLEQWKHYRLKGSQTDYTDAVGRPALLGNSVTEAGFVGTASCITCHSRAAATPQGTSAFPLFGEKSNLPLMGISQTNMPYTTILTYHGLPDPNWYYQAVGQDAPFAGAAPGLRLRNLQTDFVWAIPFQAQSTNQGAGGGGR